MKGDLFHIKNFENRFGEAPTDMILVMREVTLSGSAGTPDLSKIVAKGAKCFWWLISITETDSSAGTLAVNTDVPGASETCKAMILARACDLI